MKLSKPLEIEVLFEESESSKLSRDLGIELNVEQYTGRMTFYTVDALEPFEGAPDVCVIQCAGVEYLCPHPYSLVKKKIEGE